MTWNRFSDQWTQQAELCDLDFETRWHLFALIEHCSRAGKYDGLVRHVDALRASDVPDPGRCLAALLDSPFLELALDGRYRLPRIGEHVPPEHLRSENARPASRRSTQAWRKRRCEAGDHDRHCPRETCPRKSGDDPGDPSPTTETRGDRLGDQSPRDRTGRDVTGQDHNAHDDNEPDWPEVAVPGPRPVEWHPRLVAGYDN